MNKNHGNGHDKSANGKGRKLRSSEWFNNPHNPGMTALYLERYLNYGLTRHEVQVQRDFTETPVISTEKHKVLQILVNLIRNAKYAMDEVGSSCHIHSSVWDKRGKK